MQAKCCRLDCPNTSGLKSCTQCGEALYCSKDCQVEAWKSGHKSECWQKKFSVLVQAIEIALFGENNGGDLFEQLSRIEHRLQQAKSTGLDNNQSTTKKRLTDILTATYMPPIVAIAINKFAVFSPFCYHGCFSTLDKATEAVRQIQLSHDSPDGPVVLPGSQGFVCAAVLDKSLPALNWAEHALIAIYIAKFTMADPLHRKSDAELLSLNLQTSLPRSSLPRGIYIPRVTVDGRLEINRT